MRRKVIACVLPAILAGSIAFANDKPTRVVSLDYCADQYVLRMLPRERILAVSPDASKSFSYMRDAAVDLPTVRTSAENVLVLKPDLVVRSYGGGPGAVAFFESAGIPVLQIPYTHNVAAIRDATLTMSEALGAPETGQQIVADFDRRIASIQSNGKRGNAIYMTPTGVTSGPGTLIHEMLLAAGFGNYATRDGWQSIPLERFVYEQPDAIAGAFFDEDAQRPARWSATRHPVAQKQMADRPTARLQGAWTSCGGWFLIDAIEVIAALPIAESDK